MAQITLNSNGVASNGSLVLQSNGTTSAVTIDASQRLIVGANSAAEGSPVEIVSNTGGGSIRIRGRVSDGSGAVTFGTNATSTEYARVGSDSNSALLFGTGSSGTERARIDSSGNFGIGTSSPNRLLSLYATQPVFQITNVASGNTMGTIQYQASGDTAFILDNQGSGSGGDIRFSQAGAERARIDSSGNLLVGTTSAFNSTSITQISGNPASNQVLSVRHTGAAPNGMYLVYTGATPNGGANYFILASDGTTRFLVASNGGIGNYSGNNANLSDRREKTNFAPATSYLDKICAIPVQTFNYIDQNLEEDGGLTLGVVAQDVQAVAPELVMESNWANKDEEPKMRLSIYQTDLQYALMKCIQEQQALITQLQADVAALKA